MSERYTTAVFAGHAPSIEPFGDDEIARITAALGNAPEDWILESCFELRCLYINAIHLAQQTARVREVRARRDTILKQIDDILALARSGAVGGDEQPLQDALRQRYKASFCVAYDQFLHAAIDVREALAPPFELGEDTADVRPGHHIGLKNVLWALRQEVDGGKRRGEDWGLAMGTGDGRGARKLHEFLSVISGRTVTPDDVRNAAVGIRDWEAEDRAVEGSRSSRFELVGTEFRLT